MNALKRLAWLAAGAAYVQIVLGQVVRITGSGLGCGPNWPLCNGHLIPPLDDVGTMIEYGHRLSALVLGTSLVALLVLAWVRRGLDGGRVLRAAGWAVALYIGIAFLGAVTVFLDLSAWAVLPHLAAALCLLWMLIGTAYAAGVAPAPVPGRTRRAALAALGLGAAVLLLGGLTANLGAAGSCLGFPLCSGSAWPSGGLAWIQWIHRLAAYAFVLHLVGLLVASRRRGAPSVVIAGVSAVLVVAMAQVAVAVAMILGHLPPVWRGLHAAVGVALWVALARLERETSVTA